MLLASFQIEYVFANDNYYHFHMERLHCLTFRIWAKSIISLPAENLFFSRFATVDMLTFALFCHQIQLEKDMLINLVEFHVENNDIYHQLPFNLTRMFHKL